MFTGQDILILESPRETSELILSGVKEINDWQQGKVFHKEGSTLAPNHRLVNVGFLRQDFPRMNELNSIFFGALDSYLKFIGVPNVPAEIKPEGYQALWYQDGSGKYEAHMDGWTKGDRQISAILYLNDGFTNGEIAFPRQGLAVTPKPGRIVLFPSNFCFPHEARPPVGADRYCIVNWFSIWPVKN